jgi:hypothetical protein
MTNTEPEIPKSGRGTGEFLLLVEGELNGRKRREG